MATVIFSTSVIVGHHSLASDGVYTHFDLDQAQGSFPASGYRITGAVLTCTLRNAAWDTITVKTAEGVELGAFSAAGTNGERTCALTTGFDYRQLGQVILYGGNKGTQIAGGSYLRVTVEWAHTASTLTLSSNVMDADKAVTAVIGAYDSSFTHQLVLTFGTRSATWNLAAGVQGQDVYGSLAWLDQIPNAASGVGTVTLYTLSGGQVIGQASAALAIRAPASTGPTFTASCAPLLTLGGVTYPSMGSRVYVQGKSGCTARIIGAAAKYGATVAAYSIRGGGYAGSGATLATGLLNTAGTTPFVFRVTDSRGNYAEQTVNITVQAYAPPQVTSLTGWRVDSGGNASPTGTRGKCRASWSHTSLGGANTCTAKAYLRPAGGSETALTARMASGSTYWVATSAGNVTLGATTGYTLRLALTDKYGTVSVSAELPTAAFAMHLNAAGTSIAFGKACEHANAVEIASDRTLYLGSKSLRDWIRDTFYPVGAMYLSTGAQTPASLWGGTWGLITDHFLVGAGSGYTVGQVGGYNTVILIQENLPAHSHAAVAAGYQVMVANNNAPDFIVGSGSAIGLQYSGNYVTGPAGGGVAHENRPPYYAVYIWRRTA